MMGLSYGGCYTLYTAAIDTRIDAAVSSCFFNERNRYLWSDWSYFGFMNEFNDAEVCALICPRALMIEVGDSDTLFAVGCGRLFEGDAAMMIASLSKLVGLPDDTRVYFGHEYTEKNLRFARTLEPDNAALREKHAWSEAQMRSGGTTTPTTIGSEKATNPFLRWASPELRATLTAQFPDLPMTDVDVFAKTRALKDNY